MISAWVFKLKTNPDYKLCQKWMAQAQEEYYDINPWEQKTAKWTKFLF